MHAYYSLIFDRDASLMSFRAESDASHRDCLIRGLAPSQRQGTGHPFRTVMQGSGARSHFRSQRRYDDGDDGLSFVTTRSSERMCEQLQTEPPAYPHSPFLLFSNPPPLGLPSVSLGHDEKSVTPHSMFIIITTIIIMIIIAHNTGNYWSRPWSSSWPRSRARLNRRGT